MKLLRWLLFAFVSITIVGFSTWLFLRYDPAQTMNVPVKEFTAQEYPDDPALLSKHDKEYSHQTLVLEQTDPTRFNFIFLPSNAKSATIIFKHIDVALMTPGLPNWTKNSANLRRIALTDRQWNRQQVSFDLKSPEIAITGGDGFEKHELYEAALTKNCLNAGLWEIQLYTLENGQKKLFYHGWFTFPLGYYKHLFERNTGLSYWRSWYYLEHWVDPGNSTIDLNQLRRVVSERHVIADYNPNESIAMLGEQKNKRKNIMAAKLTSWQDFFSGGPIAFATFVPPGNYRLDKPWRNEYWRLQQFDGAMLRQIASPADPHKHYEELVLNYSSAQGDKSDLVISGFDVAQLPHLTPDNYSQGHFMLMGIAVPPIYQTYADLMRHPPNKSPEFFLQLDDKSQWINHHKAGIDGAILFIDKSNPTLLHVYLVSYERHTLLSHYVISLTN